MRANIERGLGIFGAITMTCCGGSLRSSQGGAPALDEPLAAPVVQAHQERPPSHKEGSAMMIGSYCPTSAGGRPGVVPLFGTEGDPEWTGEAEILQRWVATGRARRFEILDYWGGRAGYFSVVGSAQSAGKTLAIGSYVGRSPCFQDGGLDSSCVENGGECTLAISILEPERGHRPYEEESESSGAFFWRSAKGCFSSARFEFEIDSSGAAAWVGSESWRGQGKAELLATPSESAACSKAFRSADPQRRGSVLGVLDLDGDGRSEFVVNVGGRFLMYVARGHPLRFVLAARAALQDL